MKAAFGVVLMALAACSSSRQGLGPDAGIDFHTGAGGGGAGGGGMGGGGSAGARGQVVIEYPATMNRNVDVLFMIDDSSGMTANQSKLAAKFSSYVDVLRALPGGLPNLHLAVVSSSMGAGRNPSITHCPSGGDQGIFHTKPLGPTCTQASLAPGQSFIIDVGGMANHTGDLADMFSCIALLGSGGCGFEHQFESILRALGADGAVAPAQNNGFLRPDAFLQVVMLSDEDDCSASPFSDLFDSSSQLVSDPLGPLQSFRCNEFGHLCAGHPPPRQPSGEVDLGTCVSAEDGRLLRVADVVSALKHLKADPTKVLVAAISAPPTPYRVALAPAQVKTDPSQWPFVDHSCMASDGTYGDPAVRTKQLVDAFGDNGLFEGICADSFAPALQAIAKQVTRAISAPCLDAAIDPATCQLVDHVVDASGNVTSTALRQCADSGDPGPCWYVETSTSECPTSQSVRFKRAVASPELSTTATCNQ